MKFTVLQQDILPKLQAVSRSVGVRAALPVLSNILISSENGRLKLAATNLEVGIIKYLNTEIVEEGEITVPAKTIIEMFAGLGAVKVEFETKGDNVEISANKFKAKINGITAAEFPVIPIAQKNGIDLETAALLNVSQIIYASAVDEGRPQLTGVLTQSGAKLLEFVATDGFRLAHRRVVVKEDLNFKNLIPKKTFEEVLRVIAEENPEVVNLSVSPDQNQIIFTIGQSILSSRLIEGNFPAWEKIIPAQFISRVVLEKEETLKAIKLASIFAKNEANIIVLNLTKEGIGLESSTKELGSQQNQIEGSVEGELLQIAFNSKFLQDAVAAAPSSQIMVEFSGPLSAVRIKPVGVEGLEYIVMPVRLS